LKEMKTLKFPNQEEAYEIVDAHARERIDELEALQSEVDGKQNVLTGTEGQIVGFDASGNAVATEMPASGLPIVTTDGGDGSYYTATVPGITALTPGITFIMIPHVDSTSTQPALKVNGLTSKMLNRQVSASITFATAATDANWLPAGYPVQVMYNGSKWIVKDLPKPYAADLYGTVPISKGGTGVTSIEDTVYTTARYRASALVSSETDPTVNGVINWTYE